MAREFDLNHYLLPPSNNEVGEVHVPHVEMAVVKSTPLKFICRPLGLNGACISES